MPIDAATLIRAGSGIAFIGVGLVALAEGRGRTRASGHQSLGAALVSFGAAFVVYNLLAASGQRDAGLLIEGILFLFCTACLVRFVLTGPWNENEAARRRARGGLVAGALAGAATLAWFGAGAAGYKNASGSLGAYFVNNGSGALMTLALALVAILAGRRALDGGAPQHTRPLAALALALVAWPSFFVGKNLIEIPAANSTSPFPLLDSPYIVVVFVTVVVVSFSWLPITRAPGGRAAWLVTWGVLVAVLAGQWESRFVDNGSGAGAGLVRTVAALLVVYALRAGVLRDGARPARIVSKGVLGASALAVLFIVAQVAQNFLAAQYGLLMGGIVAGAFLFLASPLQRAMESMRERTSSPAERHMSEAEADEHETMFRNAVRLALRDRRLSRDEERHLFHLAHGLRIPAHRAHEILTEIEREMGAA